jgi:hypothetical protein
MKSVTRRQLNEIVPDATPEIPGAQAPSPGGANVDKLFYGARSHLQQAQKQLHDLLELLQNGHQGVDSAPVADCYKATAESIDTMDQLAKKWQEEAQKARMGEALSFDDRPYVKEKIFYERPKSLHDIQKETSFEFDRFLLDISQE